MPFEQMSAQQSVLSRQPPPEGAQAQPPSEQMPLQQVAPWLQLAPCNAHSQSPVGPQVPLQHVLPNSQKFPPTVQPQMSAMSQLPLQQGVASQLRPPREHTLPLELLVVPPVEVPLVPVVVEPLLEEVELPVVVELVPELEAEVVVLAVVGEDPEAHAAARARVRISSLAFNRIDIRKHHRIRTRLSATLPGAALPRRLPEDTLGV